MEFKRGTVVRSKAGHDRGRYMTVLETDGNRILTADGNTRSVQSPKKKNAIHLSATATVLCEQQMENDASLRKALEAFNGTQTI